MALLNYVVNRPLTLIQTSVNVIRSTMTASTALTQRRRSNCPKPGSAIFVLPHEIFASENLSPSIQQAVKRDPCQLHILLVGGV
jgi:hypothetical protein